MGDLAYAVTEPLRCPSWLNVYFNAIERLQEVINFVYKLTQLPLLCHGNWCISMRAK
ncbi:hypothetical protein [Candidatus Enterovibrio altilux]|uniref:Uncharacterized protein n=1 Tax=Candidatus Enterovibrio altilux TaxID=1927128 RepID=A0A291BAK7_9GAMM|nr:hypothetical protein [Candidatus Enterovibrio luxaltus]ATF10014.1 hypothetical protein BTN50_1541 [Candidatus Enterovibrio luxaltus]